MPALVLDVIDSDYLLGRLQRKKFFFCGTVSFEERSLSWCRALTEAGLLPREMLVFDYETVAVPEDEDRNVRGQQRTYFSGVLGESAPLPFSHARNAFALTGLEQQMRSLFKRASGGLVLIDISCMTRVHIFATIRGLLRSERRGTEVVFCYTSPRYYGFERGSRLCWKDVLFVPIGEPGRFEREGHARGLILVGHDGERLCVALQELEPAAGKLVYSSTRDRPDFLKAAHEANSHVTERLLRLRMPGSMLSNDRDMSWHSVTVPIESSGELESIVKEEVERAQNDRAPIIMYPFGPKIQTLSASLVLASTPGTSAWAVYPVPFRFDMNYTRGTEKLYCFSLRF